MNSKQTLFNTSQTLEFGKYKGRLISDIYSGSATEIIAGFAELMHKSLELLFSKEFYSDNSRPDVINLSGIGGIDNKRINEKKLLSFVIALHKGAKCDYEISPKKIKVKVRNKDGEVDHWLSLIACEIAQEYVTRSFVSFNMSNSIYDSNNVIRPDVLPDESLSFLEDKIEKASGNPSYIHWCIRKVDGFCLRGSELAINDLDLLPVFSFDSVGVKVGHIKSNFSFKLGYYINANFMRAGKETVDINYNKYVNFTKARSTTHYPEEVFHDDIDDFRGNDDDEDNIMRGLDSGNGDQFGF